MSFSGKRTVVHYQHNAAYAISTIMFCQPWKDCSRAVTTTQNWQDVNCKRCKNLKPKFEEPKCRK